MTTLVFLPAEMRSTRPTMAEVLDALRQTTWLTHDDRGTVAIGPSPTSTQPAARCGLIKFIFSDGRDPVAIQLPTSTRFSALRVGYNQSESFQMTQLADARVNGDGSVTLIDGTRLRAVEFTSARTPIAPSALDQQIIKAFIKARRAESVCYRPRSELQPELFRIVLRYHRNDSAYLKRANELMLDFAALRQLSTPPLERLLEELDQVDLTLAELSRQKLADTLAMYGVRIPKPSKGRRQPDFATI